MKYELFSCIMGLMLFISACAQKTEETAVVSPTEVVTTVLPKIASLEEAEVAWEAREKFLWDFAREKYAEAFLPHTNIYTVELSKSETLIWAFNWCASDETTLDQNYTQIDLKFVLEGKEVPEDQLAVYYTSRYQCRMIYTALSDWKVGEYHLSTTATFKSDINDGSSTYEAGDYIDDFTVYVKP